MKFYLILIEVFNMSYKSRTSHFSITTLAFAIAAANSSYIQADDPNRELNTTGMDFTDNATSIDISDKGQNVNLEWKKFNILENETFEFIQADNGVVVNQIVGGSVSEIMGGIKANGHVFLVNENGFTFGKNAVIDTQGFLATTFSAVLNESDVTLSPGTGEGVITLNKLDIVGDTQYVAFYSPSINVNGSVTDQTTGNDTHISLNTQTSTGTVTIPGLPIEFTVKTDEIKPITQSLTIQDETTSGANDQGTITSQNGTVILNAKNIDNLLNSNITLPKQITAKNLIASVSSNTKFSKSLNFNNSGIENFTLNSTEDIAVNSYIVGSNLSLNLKGKNINVNEISPEYGYLGSSNGLKNISLETIDSGAITLSNSIKASETLSLLGDVTISVLNAEKEDKPVTITLRADNEIKINSLNYANATSKDRNLDIITKKLTLGDIKTNFEELTIRTDNITLTGSSYDYKNSFSLSYYDNKLTNMNLEKTIKFTGNELDLSNTVFNLTENDVVINFGDSETGQKLKALNLENISMSESSHGFKSLNFNFDNSATSMDLNGQINTKEFILTKNDQVDFTINTNDSLNIKGLQNFDINNAKINATDNIVTIIGDSADNTINPTATIGNIKAKELSISGFNKLNINASRIETQDGDLTLDANNLLLNGSDLTLATESGNIKVTNTINANNNSVTINSGSKGFELSGISNANNITINKSGPSNNNTTQSLSGDYIASGYIDMKSLGSISLTSDVTLSAEKTNAGFGINLQGTKITSLSDITIKGDNIKLGEINAAAIRVSNYSDASNGLHLTGNLIANDPANSATPSTLDLNVSAIELLNDLTLEGDINFLDAKTLTETGLRFTDSNELAPTINGSKHLTLNAKNKDDVYLYNFGETTKLASLTLNGEGRLHMVGFPNISNSSGLSILGKWDWDLADPLTFTTDDYDLNLSGVNLNAVGVITFDTGSGSLSLGSIGSKGTVTELIINNAGSLNLHGDINLVGALGYDFSNVGAINLHKDMTFGSQDLPTIVNFGDADINGTFDLNIYSDDITLGEIGSIEALQDLNIFSSSDLVFDHSINLVGNANITANKISVNNEIRSTGLDINLNAVSDISMSKDATLYADYGNITLDSQTGNIGLGALISERGDVTIKSHAGYINNAIGDYVSNSDASSNITSNSLTLLGKVRVGDSVANPIVIDIENNGVISAESDGNIYIANRNNAGINSQGRVIDTTSKSGTAIIDAFNLIQSTSMNSLIEPNYKTTLGLIENSNWQLDEEDNIKTIKTPNPSPNLYYSRQGWRLGY
ncbi:MAG: filamentous hemagglutinin N-terminal domain-containing protein [Bermanella sp.]